MLPGLVGLVMYSPCAAYDTCRESISTTTMLCLEGSSLLHPSPSSGSYIQHPFSSMFPEPWDSGFGTSETDTDVPFRVQLKDHLFPALR